MASLVKGHIDGEQAVGESERRTKRDAGTKAGAVRERIASIYLAHLAGQSATHIGFVYGYTPSHINRQIRDTPAYIKRHLEDLHRRGLNSVQRIAEIAAECP